MSRVHVTCTCDVYKSRVQVTCTCHVYMSRVHDYYGLFESKIIVTDLNVGIRYC